MKIDLQRGRFLRIQSGAGSTVAAHAGSVWITEEASTPCRGAEILGEEVLRVALEDSLNPELTSQNPSGVKCAARRFTHSE